MHHLENNPLFTTMVSNILEWMTISKIYSGWTTPWHRRHHKRHSETDLKRKKLSSNEAVKDTEPEPIFQNLVGNSQLERPIGTTLLEFEVAILIPAKLRRDVLKDDTVFSQDDL